MNVDLNAATAFMATHARVLDRRRFEVLTQGTGAEGVVAAMDGYRNPDGGYGWGLEPDLRSPESQPGAALHAFEALVDLDTAVPQAAALCDWLESVTLPDGGLPFALPVTDPAGCAPWWSGHDAGTSSLQITSIVLANALRVAAHDPAVAAHPWLAGATRYCLAAIEALEDAPHAIELAFAVQLLDVLPEHRPDLLKKLGGFIPESGFLQVEGGTADERIGPLDFAPSPGPARSLFRPEVVAAELERLRAGQRDDGGWSVEYAQISPAGVLDWRGHATVRAVSVLKAEGLL
ncbi:hypothetical protein ACIBF1_22550 [Spirillospora sp. NPDC050679]